MRAKVLTLLVVAALALAVQPGATQTPPTVPTAPIAVGQTTPSALTQPVARYHELPMNAGQSVRIHVRSEAFQPLVTVGRLANGAFEELDFQPSGGSDARIWFVAPADGAYVIQVASFSPFGFGPYEIEVKPHPVAPAPAAKPLVLGSELAGRLSAGGARIGDRLYDVFTLRTSEPNQRVEIEVTGTGFRPAIDASAASSSELPRLGSSSPVYTGSNQARLYRTFPTPGDYGVLVSAVGSDDAGAFTVVARGLPQPSKTLPRPLVLTERAQGRLVLGETVIPVEAAVGGAGFRPYALYEVRGRRGESYDISLRADTFPPRLEIGSIMPGGFATLKATSLARPGEVHLAYAFEANGSIILRVSPLGEGRIRAAAAPEEGAFEVAAVKVSSEAPVQRRVGGSTAYRIDVFACEGVAGADGRAQRIVDLLKQRAWAPEGVTVAEVRKRALSEAMNRTAGYDLSDDRLRADRDEQGLARAVIELLGRATPPLTMVAGNSPGTASPNYLSVFVCRR